MTMVSITELRKTYQVREREGWFRNRKREIVALAGVNLAVQSGEIFGLLGPNGAGKTTLIKCLTTLLLPTSGQMRVNGHDVLKEADAVRASLGCLLMGERGLYWKLTGRENLEYTGALYSLPRAACRQRAAELIERLGLGPVADRPVESYSSGQKMKVAFARALIPPAPLLVLDEPTNTLDVPSARELRAVVRELNAAGRTVIYTTHQMPEAEDLCKRVAIIDHGQVIACGLVDELKRDMQGGGAIRVEGVISEAAFAAVRELNAAGRTVIYTTHQMPEAEDLCKRVAIIDHGQVIACGLVDELKRDMQGGGAIRVEGVISEAAFAAVRELALVNQAALGQADGRQQLRVVSAQPRQLLPELIHCLYSAGAQIEEIAPVTVTLEDVFLSLTGRSLSE